MFGQVNPLFGRYPSPVGCLSLARQRVSLIRKQLFGQSRLALDHFIGMFPTTYCVLYAISAIEICCKHVTWILLNIQKFKSLLDIQGNVLHFSMFFCGFLFHLKHRNTSFSGRDMKLSSTHFLRAAGIELCHVETKEIKITNHQQPQQRHIIPWAWEGMSFFKAESHWQGEKRGMNEHACHSSLTN